VFLGAGNPLFGSTSRCSKLLLPLTVGARIHLVDRATAMDGSALARAIDDGWVTVVQGDADHAPDAGGGRVAGRCRGHGGVRAASRLPADLAGRAAGPGASGCGTATDRPKTTVYTHALRLSPGDPVRLGGPLTDVRTYLLDEDLRAGGGPGEVGRDLPFAGPCLATGYLNRPALTAGRFLPDPFDAVTGPAECTGPGDLARMTDGPACWRPLGPDRPPGQTCAATVSKLGEGGGRAAGRRPGAGTRWCSSAGRARTRHSSAAWVPEGDEPPDRDETACGNWARRLPGYLVPARFTVLDRLPLTPERQGSTGPAVAASGRRPPAAPDQRRTAGHPAGTGRLPGCGWDLLDVATAWASTNPCSTAGANSVTLMRAGPTCSRRSSAYRSAVRVLFDRPTVGRNRPAIWLGHGTGDDRRNPRTDCFAAWPQAG